MKRFIARSEEGQGIIEYALLAGLVSIVAIVAIRAIGPQLTATFNDIVAALT
ncbi:MAG: Flp family type IVb pilin [Candidatus Latescibacterota bacterium]